MIEILLKYIYTFLPTKFRRNIYLDKELKIKIFYLVPLSILSSVLEILSISLLVPILAYFVELESFSNNSFLKIQNILDSIFVNLSLSKILILILFLFFLKNIFMLIIIYFRHTVNNLISKNISHELYENYINLEFSNILHFNTHSIQKNLTTEVALYGRYIFSLIILVTELVLLVSLIAFLFYINFYVTMSIIGLLSIFVILFYYFSKSFITKWSKNREYLENLRFKNIQEVFSGFMTVKVFKLENFFVKDFLKKNNFYDYIKKERFVSEIPRYFLEMFLLIVILIVVMFTQFMGDEKKEFFILISLFVVLFIRMLPSVNKILVSITSMKYCINSINILGDQLNKFKNYKSKEISKPEINISPLKFNEQINLENISFYFDIRNNILNKLNFVIKKNTIIGISGRSGSGKSTLINILAGLLEPRSGEIFLDGKLANTYSNKWRNLFSYVPQNIFIFEDTIKNNILLNNSNNNITDDDLLDLITKLKLDKLVKNKEDLNNFLAEDGLSLSGGEKQRIGFARALICKKPILILDEATNALDKLSQNEILKLISTLKKETTIVIVSHDSEVLNICDNVITLNS